MSTMPIISDADIEKAVSTGNMKQIKIWAREKFINIKYNLRNAENNSLLTLAAEKGQHAIVKWLVTGSKQKVEIAQIVPYTRTVTHNAAETALENKHPKIARWLLEQPTNNTSYKTIYGMWLNVTNHFDLKFFKWFYDYALDRYPELTDFIPPLLANLARYGHFSAVKWLVTKRNVIMKTLSEDHQWLTKNEKNAALDAVNAGHYHIAKWLLQRPNTAISKNDIMPMLETAACCDEQNTVLSNFEYFKWFCGYAKKHKSLNKNKLFAVTVANGSLAKIAWVFNEPGPPPDLKSNNYEAIRSAATSTQENKVDIIKWLIETSNQKIDCCKCEKWVEPSRREYRHAYGKAPFTSWDKEVKEYLLSVKKAQYSLGIDVWAAGIKYNVSRAPKTKANRQQRGSF